jgi:hypothetical protein
LQKGKEAVTLIIFHNVPHSVSRIGLLHHYQKFLDDPILLSSVDVVQSDVSSDAFTRFMEIRGGAELHGSPEILDDLMLLAREFGYNGLITRLVPQRDFPRREENVHGRLQELNMGPRGTTIEAEFQFATALPMCDSAHP